MGYDIDISNSFNHVPLYSSNWLYHEIASKFVVVVPLVEVLGLIFGSTMASNWKIQLRKEETVE